MSIRRHVIVKASREYHGGPGYAGPACKQAGIEPGRIYDTRSDAYRDGKKLSAVNPVGFRVVPYVAKPHEEALTPFEEADK
jgi:hypothetical protein